jgi:adenylate cyclase
MVIEWLSSRRNLRLASGLVLFTYVTFHLGCHASGLVSLDLAEACLRTTVRLWHSVPGTVLLYGAAALHVGLALLAIYDRRTLRMAPLNGLRIVLGLVMPLSLIGHFVATRYAFERFGLAAEYSRIASGLWSSGSQGLTLGLLAPGWAHGCLGLRFAFGHRRLWRHLRMELFAFALLLPVLAGLGFVSMGRELAAPRSAIEQPAGPSDTQQLALVSTREAALTVYVALIGLVLFGRLMRTLEERRRNSVVHIAYPSRNVAVPRGWSVLEASRSFGIPHQSMCEGRGRCSTCRVRVIDGALHCPPPSDDEKRTLARIDAPETVRLACQLRPTGDIAVEPILHAEQARWTAGPQRSETAEREVAVLFFDLKLGSATARSHAHAHDAIYALEQFQLIVEGALEIGDGRICRNTGDHWLALFGLEASLRESCRQAMAAALRIEQQATVLRERLARELGLHSEFTVGAHAGIVVAGMIGSREWRTLLAVGEAIDSTARLQDCAARESARIVISRQAALGAGMDGPELDWRPVGIDIDGTPMLWSEVSAAEIKSAFAGALTLPSAGP